MLTKSELLDKIIYHKLKDNKTVFEKPKDTKLEDRKCGFFNRHSRHHWQFSCKNYKKQLFFECDYCGLKMEGKHAKS